VRAPGRQPTMPSAPLTTRNATSAPSSTTATPVATSRTVRGRTRTRSPGERGWALHRLARPWVAGASVGGNTRRARTDEHGGDDAAGREAEMVHVAEDGTIAYGSPDFDWSILTVPTALAVVRGQLGFSWLEVSDRLATLTQAELEWEPGPDALRVVRRGTERAPRTLGVGEWVMEWPEGPARTGGGSCGGGPSARRARGAWASGSWSGPRVRTHRSRARSPGSSRTSRRCSSSGGSGRSARTSAVATRWSSRARSAPRSRGCGTRWTAGGRGWTRCPRRRRSPWGSAGPRRSTRRRRSCTSWRT